MEVAKPYQGKQEQVGVCSAEEAELWRLEIGLREAWEEGTKAMKVEIDTPEISRWIKKHERETPRHHNLLVECKELLKRDWRVEIKHVLRESNQVANGLAKFGGEQYHILILLCL